MNRQIGIGDSKYVLISEPLPPGDVTRRMRCTFFWPLICAEESIWYLPRVQQRQTLDFWHTARPR